MKLFDTNILIDYFSGHAEARRILLAEKGNAISVVTWAELMTGCKSPADRHYTSEFVHRHLRIIPADEAIGTIAAEVRRRQRLKLPDALILATALHLKTELFTRDRKDFGDYLSFVNFPYALH